MDDNVRFCIKEKIRQSCYQIFLPVRDIDMVTSYCKSFHKMYESWCFLAFIALFFHIKSSDNFDQPRLKHA